MSKLTSRSVLVAKRQKVQKVEVEALGLILFCSEGAFPDALWMFVTYMYIFLGLVLKYILLLICADRHLMQAFQRLKPPNLEVSKIYPKGLDIWVRFTKRNLNANNTKQCSNYHNQYLLVLINILGLETLTGECSMSCSIILNT